MSYSHPNSRYQYRSEPNHGQSSSQRYPVDYSGGESSSSRYGYDSRDYGYSQNRGEGYRAERDHPYNDRSREYPEYRDYGYGGYKGRNDYSYNRPYENSYPSPAYDQNAYNPNEGRSTSTYIPPHQRGFSSPILPSFPPTLPLRPPSPQSQPPSRQYHSQPQSRPFVRDRTVTPPPVNLPPPKYLDLLRPNLDEPLSSERIVPKLLVLDLNGALVYRNRSSSSEGRNSHPRPYLQSFLEYLFLPDRQSKRGKRGWEVFVWSSAQPHNVRGMVESAFGPRFIEGIWEEESEEGRSAREQEGEGRLLGVWARDKMGLRSGDYSRKVQTTKDLRKVLDHLRHPPHDSPQPPWEFDEKRIVLLDDSPLKAIYQPFNQLVIPEFGKEEYQNSKIASSAGDGEMDQTLLAVIGILDELKYVNNVPFWIRSGGLLHPSSTSNPSNNHVEIGLEDLPSHDSFSHWFSHPDMFEGWVEKGKSTLRERGIDIRHGISPDPNSISQLQKSKSSRGGSSPPVKLYSKGRRGYHTNDGIDHDEVSSPPPPDTPHSSHLRPLDVARYIDSLIYSTSNLTVEQKDSLVVAREIISDLAVGQGVSNGYEAEGTEEMLYQAASSPRRQNQGIIHDDLLNPPPQEPKRRKQHNKEYRREWKKAKARDPALTNKQFRKMFKALKKEGAIPAHEEGISESDDGKEEIVEDDGEGVEEISKLEFLNNYQKNLSFQANQVEDGDGLSVLSSGYGSGSGSRNGSKKKLRSDSWSGE
ncbi:hypothetical protein I302_101726 [Kwoniella bestiolae CBS 10118]|uniref:FCP1 homology domain-containing protein n=1 Tax=Kwoniella bestiolae CBS 10118 TaxID=1296100 RepID=A0A1B9GD18_9TREE|nr:hypothetical protein I302_00402 [Kwoniella bestiolae CBS 10118]OCF28912.1 hypothetical protein I302_00402 [Kwoniella bestiolae CBS 10118]